MEQKGTSESPGMSSMSDDKVFLDTNIIVYAYDITAGAKHETAKDTLTDLWESGAGVISTQVLQEFFVTVTRKIPNPLDSAKAKEIVSDLLTWDVVVIDGAVITSAIELLPKFGYSFWDSLIIQAAIDSGAVTLLSEDLSHRQTIEGISIINPFIDDI